MSPSPAPSSQGKFVLSTGFKLSRFLKKMGWIGRWSRIVFAFTGKEFYSWAPDAHSVRFIRSVIEGIPGRRSPKIDRSSLEVNRLLIKPHVRKRNRTDNGDDTQDGKSDRRTKFHSKAPDKRARTRRLWFRARLRLNEEECLSAQSGARFSRYISRDLNLDEEFFCFSREVPKHGLEAAILPHFRSISHRTNPVGESHCQGSRVGISDHREMPGEPFPGLRRILGRTSERLMREACLANAWRCS